MKLPDIVRRSQEDPDMADQRPILPLDALSGQGDATMEG